jgi:hypothetical protein
VSKDLLDRKRSIGLIEPNAKRYAQLPQGRQQLGLDTQGQRIPLGLAVYVWSVVGGAKTGQRSSLGLEKLNPTGELFFYGVAQVRTREIKLPNTQMRWRFRSAPNRRDVADLERLRWDKAQALGYELRVYILATEHELSLTARVIERIHKSAV